VQRQEQVQLKYSQRNNPAVAAFPVPPRCSHGSIVQPRSEPNTIFRQPLLVKVTVLGRPAFNLLPDDADLAIRQLEV